MHPRFTELLAREHRQDLLDHAARHRFRRAVPRARGVVRGSMAERDSRLRHGPTRAQPTTSQAGALIYLGAIVTVVGFLGWYSGVGRLGTARAALFLGIIPPASYLLAVTLRTTRFHWRPGLRCVLVGAGLATGIHFRKGGSSG